MHVCTSICVHAKKTLKNNNRKVEICGSNLVIENRDTVDNTQFIRNMPYPVVDHLS